MLANNRDEIFRLKLAKLESLLSEVTTELSSECKNELGRRKEEKESYYKDKEVTKELSNEKEQMLQNKLNSLVDVLLLSEAIKKVRNQN